MRKLSTLLVVAVFAIGSAMMVGCDSAETPAPAKDDASSASVAPADSDAPAASDLTKVSFDVTGMS